MKAEVRTTWFLRERRRYDAWRRQLIAWLLGRLYRATERTLCRNGKLPLTGIVRVLVCRPNHRLGNTLLLTPLIVELGRTFPEAKVDVVVGGGAGAEVFLNFSNVEVVVCLPRHMAKHPIFLVRTLFHLRRRQYDLAVDPSEASQSGRLLLAIVKAKHAIGMSSADGVQHPEAALDMPTHMGQLPVFLLRKALARSARTDRLDYPKLTLGLTANERQAAQATLAAMTRAQGQSSPRATVGLFASATGNKRYDNSWWQRFVAEIRARHGDYAVVELASERGEAQLPEELPSFSSKSIREVAAFISNMTCFICADCGVMHLAAASGVTTIGLFSASDPAPYAPYGQSSRAIVTIGKDPQEVAREAIALIEETMSSPTPQATQSKSDTSQVAAQ